MNIITAAAILCSAISVVLSAISAMYARRAKRAYDDIRQMRARRDPASTTAARTDLAPRRTTHPTGFRQP